MTFYLSVHLKCIVTFATALTLQELPLLGNLFGTILLTFIHAKNYDIVTLLNKLRINIFCKIKEEGKTSIRWDKIKLK